MASTILLVGCADPAPPSTAPSTSAPSSTPTPSSASSEQAHPDVLSAEVERAADGHRVSATISSPYDTPERYADAFRVVAPDGTVLGVRELLHDHADEQPFTRTLDDVQIPDGVDEVVVEARDSANGWGGATVTVAVPS